MSSISLISSIPMMLTINIINIINASMIHCRYAKVLTTVTTETNDLQNRARTFLNTVNRQHKSPRFPKSSSLLFSNHTITYNKHYLIDSVTPFLLLRCTNNASAEDEGKKQLDLTDTWMDCGTDALTISAYNDGKVFCLDYAEIQTIKGKYAFSNHIYCLLKSSLLLTTVDSVRSMVEIESKYELENLHPLSDSSTFGTKLDITMQSRDYQVVIEMMNKRLGLKLKGINDSTAVANSNPWKNRKVSVASSAQFHKVPNCFCFLLCFSLICICQN